MITVNQSPSIELSSEEKALLVSIFETEKRSNEYGLETLTNSYDRDGYFLHADGSNYERDSDPTFGMYELNISDAESALITLKSDSISLSLSNINTAISSLNKMADKEWDRIEKIETTFSSDAVSIETHPITIDATKKKDMYYDLADKLSAYYKVVRG